MTMAVRLRDARERAGLSARALDERAGITPGHTSLIETGRRESPSVDTVRKISEALGVSLDWLIAGRSVSDSGEHIATAASDTDAA